VAHLQQRNQELLGNERLLQETLTTAQHLSEDLKQTALKEAEMTISQAEIQGEKILDAAHRRSARLAEDLREMKLLRSRVAAGLRATLEHHLELIAHLSEDPFSEDPQLESRIDALVKGGDPSGPA
jgi:cell division initiation protein